MPPRKSVQARVFRNFREQERAEQDYWKSLTPAERLDMMWQLTLDVWSFTGTRVAESRLQRHIVSIHRSEG